MFHLEMGDATISSVVEVSGPRYVPDFMFPQITDEEIARNAGWMAPDLYDPARSCWRWCARPTSSGPPITRF